VGGCGHRRRGDDSIRAIFQDEGSAIDAFSVGPGVVSAGYVFLERPVGAGRKTNTELQADLKVVTDKLKITQAQLEKARAEAAKTE